MKLKMLKKTVSVLCVAAVVASFTAPCVGAFLTPDPGLSTRSGKNTPEANKVLEGVSQKVDKMMMVIKKEQSLGANIDQYRKTKLSNLLSTLELCKGYLDVFDRTVILWPHAAMDIKWFFDSKKARLDDINIEDSNHVPDEYFAIANEICEFLKRTDEICRHHELKTAEELFKQVKETFYRDWKCHAKFRDSLEEYKQAIKTGAKRFDPTYESRQKAEYLCVVAENNWNKENVKNAVNACYEAIVSMDEFSRDGTLKLAKEMFWAKRGEFYKKWDEHVKFRDNLEEYKAAKQAGVEKLDPTYNDRHIAEEEINKFLNGQYSQDEQTYRLTASKLQKAIDSMNEFEKANKK